jgi:hypothetical protein
MYTFMADHTTAQIAYNKLKALDMVWDKQNNKINAGMNYWFSWMIDYKRGKAWDQKAMAWKNSYHLEQDHYLAIKQALVVADLNIDHREKKYDF